MTFSFVDHDGSVPKDLTKDFALVKPERIINCSVKAEAGSFCKDLSDADVIFSHVSSCDLPTVFSKLASKPKTHFLLVISHEEYRDGETPKAEYYCKDMNDANSPASYVLRVINQKPINGDNPDPKAVTSLLHLTERDASYVYKCLKNNIRVEFSQANEKTHSKHHDAEDYKALNLLFNKPANSDTLVAWYMLAKACSICTDEEKKKNLLLDRDAWKINDTWSGFDEKKAANAIKEDFAFLKDSWGLKFDNEQEIIDSLVEFARIIYGNSCSLDEDSINRVLTALQQVFSSKDTQKVNSSAKKNTTIVKRNDKAEKSKTSAKKTSSSKKTTKKGGK